MSYIPVSSNDALKHLALQGSPETLCGKLAVSHPSTTDTLNCDICLTLSHGDSLLKQTQASSDCPYCNDGIDATGQSCWNCGGTGWLDEGGQSDYATDLDRIDSEEGLHGVKVANAACENCGKATNGISVTQGNEEWCVGCASRAPAIQKTDLNKPEEDAPNKEVKVATNWTRDGEAIEDGVVISKEQAARTPFLDLTRVSVSEKLQCPDCNTEQWLSKIASCVDCDGLKCSGCMETLGLDSFLGTCKKCAGADPDLYEPAYEESYPEPDRYLSYLMTEDDEDTDPLFLPDSFD